MSNYARQLAVRAGAIVRLGLALILVSLSFCVAAGKPGGNQPPTVQLTSPANGASFVAPATVSLAATASDPDGTITRVDFYQGNNLIGTAFSPPYTATWNNVAQGNYSLTARATDNGGTVTTSAAASISVASGTALVVTSPANGANVNVSLFNALTVTGTFEGPPESTILVDNEQSSILATISGNTYTASFNPVSQRLAVGPNTITVKLARPDGTSASRTISVNGYENPYVALTGPSCNTFTGPGASILLAADAKVPGGNVTQVQFLQGSTVLATLTAPPYQFNWTNVAVGNYTITAKATSNFGTTTTSTPMQISVLGPNTPPTISITSPANGATFIGPANIPITVNASDPDAGGSVKTVEYFQNGNLFAVSNVPPFGTTWSNVPNGNYSITARATDDRNGQTTSAPVNVFVNPPTQPPTVSLTAPTNGSTFVISSNVTLSANAADPDGTISKVEFYTGTTLIGTSTTPPYSVTWTAVTPGANVLTAKAYDNFNVSTTSAPVNVTVTGAITYLHNDFAGNPIAATDAGGGIVWKENFRPYGDRLNNQPAASGNRQWFHGKAVDADTGLSYFGARYYDAALGRFMGVDTATFTEQNLHSFNRYAYGNNNPLKFVDPDGNSPLSVFAVEVAKQTGAGYLLGVVADSISQYAAFGQVDVSMAANSNAAIAGGAAGLLSGAVSGTVRAWTIAKASKDFFAGTKYTEKVVQQMSKDDFHAFPESVKAFQESGKVSKIKGGDGVVREKLEIPGEYRGREGVFRFIKEADGSINHRQFHPNVD